MHRAVSGGRQALVRGAATERSAGHGPACDLLLAPSSRGDPPMATPCRPSSLHREASAASAHGPMGRTARAAADRGSRRRRNAELARIQWLLIVHWARERSAMATLLAVPARRA
jgi:hypothetical protein